MQNTGSGQNTGPGLAFDRTAALARIGGDAEVLDRLMRVFSRQSRELLAEVAENVSRRDREGLARAAHKLRGAVGVFSSGDAFQTALDLEMHSREDDFTHLEKTCEQLHRHVHRLQEALSA